MRREDKYFTTIKCKNISRATRRQILHYNQTQEQLTCDEKTNTSLQSNVRTSHVRRDDKYFTTIKRKNSSRATRRQILHYNQTQEQLTYDEMANTTLQSNARTAHVRRDGKYFTTIKRKNISRATRWQILYYNQTLEHLTYDEMANTSPQSNARTNHVRGEDEYYNTIERKNKSRAR
ncbi:hypothetical protein M3210_14860 [Oceanobacillus luteolus]|uniref:hypothetical protein n=1 Tax=Oceanobacillus luteolus TaxID=1274358 RepID=UPI00203B1DAF|nr:hypothetical protein [Oceanobacillus luteolus]MCM3741532.1 hypothetical protein [Oceanobacillus luteolus]